MTVESSTTPPPVELLWNGSWPDEAEAETLVDELYDGSQAEFAPATTSCRRRDVGSRFEMEKRTELSHER